MGEPGTTYMQCCQFRHAWNWLIPWSRYAQNPVAQTHMGTFFSGHKNSDTSFKSTPGHEIPFNLNNNEHTLLYIKTKIVNGICSPNQCSIDCENAKCEVKSAFVKEDINWHTVKEV
ncbi:hypothetical protein PIROE2DRAFT_16279 [Piromyces sp. E2]|nr:hypothetical protein PIROE2DRAFT_16279 [Piromyces sp. E2]|eukprot:OUM58448.1 hypothetical protein PIROE2DRAFT_16279 [Piromyces sp. E2]